MVPRQDESIYEVKTKTVTLGASSEGVAKSESLFIQELRSLFLNNVSKIAPEVSDNLNNELLELYRRIPLFCYEADGKRSKKKENRSAWRGTCRPTWGQIEDAWNSQTPNVPFELKFDDYYAQQDKKDPCLWYMPGNMPAHKDPNVRVFIEKMFDWSRTNHLNEGWCREHAYQTLDLWCQSQDYCEARYWTFVEFYSYGFFRPVPIIQFYPRFIFKYDTLYPRVRLREEIKKKITESFETELEKFLDEFESDAEKCGLSTTLQKYALYHFEWLADYQVNHQSKRGLAKKYGVDRKTIIDGLDAAADLIKLTLRK